MSHVSSPHRYCRNPMNSASRFCWCRFQALIGTVETLHRRADITASIGVSSPHRYCRNRPRRGQAGGGGAVSSPHRYCRNSSKARSSSWLSVSFQALIGTVETNRSDPGLQGSRKFQALIGTVETRNSATIAATRVPVSSPHRYCRNSAGRWLAATAIPPFQALIGTVETRLRRRFPAGGAEFQALIGTVETTGTGPRTGTGAGFKPS